MIIYKPTQQSTDTPDNIHAQFWLENLQGTVWET